MGNRRRRSVPHAAPARWRVVVRWHAVHGRGRGVLLPSGNRPQSQRHSLVPAGRRQTHRAVCRRSQDRQGRIRGPVRAGSARARRAAHPAPAQAGIRLHRRPFRGGVVDADAAGRRRGPGAVLPLRPTNPGSAWCWSGTRTIGAPRPTARACRISIASCSKWCPTRTPNSCGCSPVRATCCRTRSGPTTTCRSGSPRNAARSP